MWDAAKNCTGLVSFQKRVYWDAPTRDKKKDKKPQKGGVNIDLSAQDGAEWIKVSTVTEGRLVRELAEKGYNANDSSDEDDSGEIDEDDMVELVKTAHDLRKASQSTRVRYKVVIPDKSFLPLYHIFFQFHRCASGLFSRKYFYLTVTDEELALMALTAPSNSLYPPEN